MRSRGPSRGARSLTELHAAPGNPGIAALGELPSRPRGRLCRDRARLARELADRPRRHRAGGAARRRASPTSCASRGIAVFGPGADAARIEGSKAFAKDVLDAGTACRPRRRSRSPARPASSRPTGSRPARASSSATTQAELDAGLRAADGARPAVPRRGAARGRGGVALRALRRQPRRVAARPPRRTTSARATATPARTPAAWAPTRRCRGSPDAEAAALVERGPSAPVRRRSWRGAGRRSSAASSRA